MARLGSWIEPFPEGIHVKPADAWIDPSRPKDKALVTHGRVDALIHDAPDQGAGRMRFVWLASLMLISCGPPERPAPDEEARIPASTTPDAMLPAPAPPPEAARAGPGAARSIFTRLDTKACRLVEQNIEEAGYSRHDCPGHAGYRLELIESDLRQNLAIVRPNGGKEELSLSAVVGGGAFSEIGKTVEWRGLDAAKPRTLTLRFDVNEDPDPNVPPRSYLVVIRLASPACPVARLAPGPQQSAQARAVADRSALPSCIGR